MKFRLSLWTLILLITCACHSDSVKNKQKNKLTTILSIENGHYRGIVYENSLGKEFTLRYIPIKLINNHSDRIQVELIFEDEYQYPGGDKDEKFKIIPMPKDWGLDGVGPSDIMKENIGKFIKNPRMNFSIEPNEEYILAIGALNQRNPPQNGGIEPKILFVKQDNETFKECDWIQEQEPVSDQALSLGLTLKSDKCTIIPCGKIKI